MPLAPPPLSLRLSPLAGRARFQGLSLDETAKKEPAAAAAAPHPPMFCSSGGGGGGGGWPSEPSFAIAVAVAVSSLCRC